MELHSILLGENVFEYESMMILLIRASVPYFFLFEVSTLKEPFEDHNVSFFKNWDSLHARLNSHYETWGYKKKKHKKIKAYRKFV